jgi:hypothetical protein
MRRAGPGPEPHCLPPSGLAAAVVRFGGTEGPAGEFAHAVPLLTLLMPLSP